MPSRYRSIAPVTITLQHHGVDRFLKGAHIVYAHSVLQQQCALGYTSQWAMESFKDVKAKNEFFEKLGILLVPKVEDVCSDFNDDVRPQQILEKFE